MKIGVDIRSLMHEKRTGVGEYTYELLNAVFSLDHDNQYYLFYNSYQDVSKNIPTWQQANVHYVVKHWPNKLFNLLIWLKLIKLDKLFKVDVWFSPNLDFTNLSKKVKHILTLHDLSFEFLPECFSKKRQWWHKFLNPKKQSQRADLVLTPSENTKRDVSDTYGVKQVKVLYPGLSELKSSGGIKKKYDLPDKFILYLGTIEPRKNIAGIIQAYKQLGDKEYTLVIAGSKGWKYEKIMQEIETTEGVQYIGYVAAADKAALYQAASLFVYPSLYEGFGFPVLEAMAQAVPVITSSRSSLPEVVGSAVYLVNPNNVAEITRGMKSILSDEKLRDILVNMGKEQAGKFSWQKTAQEFIQLL